MNLDKEIALVKKLFTTRLGQGGLVMVGGSFIVGFISFLLNPVMGILLGPHLYGELIAILSLQLIFSVPALTLNTVLIKASARYQAKGEIEKVGQLFVEITQKLFLSSVVVVLLFWLGRDILAAFLQVEDSNLIVLLGILTMVVFFFTANGAILQGLLKFEIYTLSTLLNSILRVLLAVGLVYLGFGVGGALGGLVLALLVSYFVGYLALKRYIKTGGRTDWRELMRATIPAFVALLGLTLLNNLDVVLVKHFFTPQEAGFYGAAVITSRVIIFASLPITQVVFPVITQRYEAKRAFHHLVQYALGITAMIGVGVSVFYLLFPELVLRVFFFGRSLEFAGAAPLLASMGLFVTFYSVNTLFIYLFLSLHKVKFALAPLLAGLVQGLIIWQNHTSLSAVVAINIGVNLVLCAVLFLYYFTDKKKLSLQRGW
jgi:O-antigen/teichoic acid export membrane protein